MEYEYNYDCKNKLHTLYRRMKRRWGADNFKSHYLLHSCLRHKGAGRIAGFCNTESISRTPCPTRPVAKLFRHKKESSHHLGRLSRFPDPLRSLTATRNLIFPTSSECSKCCQREYTYNTRKKCCCINRIRQSLSAP